MGRLSHKGELVGMHTYDDAAVFVSPNVAFKTDGWEWVGDIGRAILEYFDVYPIT